MRPRRIWADLLVFGRGYVRNPLGLFFSVIFPLILIGLFGLIFSHTGPSAVTLYTENLDGNSNASQAFLSALNSTGAVQVQLVSPSSGDLRAWLADNNHPVGLVVPAGFQANYSTHQPVQLQLYTDPGDPTSAGIAEGALNGVINGFNLKAAGGTPLLSATVGTLLFGAHVTLTLPLVPFLVLGPFLFVSLGMLAGSLAKTPESAAIIGNIITAPMMFLAGTFFPVSSFSPELQAVAHALPLYYIIDGMNQVMLFQNYGNAGTDLIVVAGIAVVIFVAAVIAFRWRDS